MITSEVERIIEERMKPHNCANCEFNFSGVCVAGDGTAGHVYGHKIENMADYCAEWGAAYEPWVDAVTEIEKETGVSIEELKADSLFDDDNRRTDLSNDGGGNNGEAYNNYFGGAAA